jgi:hypothetical protein
LVQKGFMIDASPSKNLHRRRDLDLLLNDWGIHHLHISNSIDGDGFVSRDGSLLFAIFIPSAAFFVDILPHREWTNQRLVEISVRNWPDAQLFLQLKGVLGVSRSITPDDRHKLRGAGIATMIEVDGGVYMSRSFGISSAGTSTRAASQATHLLRQIHAITENLKMDNDYLKPSFEQAGVPYPKEPSFRLVFTSGFSEYVFAIFEEQTQLAIGLT